MKITPIEIRKKEFERAFRGYEKEEVDAFLQTLSGEWEKIVEENKEWQRKLETAEKEIARMREVETTFYKTLKTAEETSHSLMEQANKTADLHVREAQMNAEALLNEARGKARAMIEDAEYEVKNILDDLNMESRAIEKEFNYIDSQKENLLEELRNYVKDTIDRVEKFANKSNRNEFDKKIKEIRNISVSVNTIRSLDITNSDVLSKAELEKEAKLKESESIKYTIKPVVEEQQEKQVVVPPVNEFKNKPEDESSFFDSI